MIPYLLTPYLLPELIERSCARWPQRTAVLDAAGVALSYAELEGQSRAWAQRLQAAGCRRGDRVGVWMPKSPQAVVGLLAVLRAGGVYVPLDAWAPEARVQALAADAGVAALLADAPRAQAARAWPQAPAAVWDMEHGPGDASGAAWRPVARTGDELAYILYTSGSTGVPKGVMLTHAHALNFITWAAAAAGLEPSDRVASHAPFHFDLSIFDLWASLSRGACVCLLDQVTARFPRAVADWMIERRIAVSYSVPSVLVALLPYAASLRPSLRTVLFAGEVFPPQALGAWREALPEAEFQNWYGPTETNVCTYYRLPPLAAGAPAALDPLPIGRACPNFELAVWDDEQQPVAAGAAGFLWARGPGILAGYWGDEARTQAVTCERVLAGGLRQRWYNTGDLVASRPDGELVYHGRRDHLLKLRGYRVSLLEVEQALEACAGVERAVVVALSDAQAPSALAAFVQPQTLPAPPALAAALRRQLSARLPVYMIPERILVCDQWPETANGKVDRQRLQSLAAARAAVPAA